MCVMCVCDFWGVLFLLLLLLLLCFLLIKYACEYNYAWFIYFMTVLYISLTKISN